MVVGDCGGPVLKALGWAPQLPITRAIQRDEEAVRRWRDAVWPDLRRRARRGASDGC